MAATDLLTRCTYRLPDVLDQPVPPNGHEPLPYFDLRRAITQMQLDRGARQTPPVEPKSPNTDLKRMFRQLNSGSFADAFVSPRAWALMEVSRWHCQTPTMLIRPCRPPRWIDMSHLWTMSLMS